MKKIILSALVACVCFGAFAQSENGYGFKTIKENPVTAVQDQASSGTCWCFSTLSFIESEIMRQGYKGDLNLSEMFVVSNAYYDKSVKYVRTDGHINLAAGSSSQDPLYVWRTYGIVPESVMPGLNYGTPKHKHAEMDAGIKGFVTAVEKNPNGEMSTAWKPAVRGILAAYLGEIPTEFEYNGKKYTPRSYADSLPFNPDDYVSVSSFTCYPLYKQYVQEVADNWRHEKDYNVTLDELVEIVYNAINNGYTVAWGSDVSETGWGKGIAVVPDIDNIDKVPGSDEAHWMGLTASQKNSEVKAAIMKEPLPEKTITPEMRQEAYDKRITTDDHGMHIYGIAQDKNGKNYFIVKNSWGDSGDFHGIWYVSESFFRYKTTDILVHKDAIPKDIRKKLGI